MYCYLWSETVRSHFYILYTVYIFIFILFRVAVDPEFILEPYIPRNIPRTWCQSLQGTIYTVKHNLSNLEQPVSPTTYFWEVTGNQSAWRKPMQRWGKKTCKTLDGTLELWGTDISCCITVASQVVSRHQNIPTAFILSNSVLILWIFLFSRNPVGEVYQDWEDYCRVAVFSFK